MYIIFYQFQLRMIFNRLFVFINVNWLIDVSIQASISMAPVNIFKHGADEEKAETARLVSLFYVCLRTKAPKLTSKIVFKCFFAFVLL